MENAVNQLERQERVVPGILGAVLFSLAGGVAWFLLWQAGIVAGLSGCIGVICAIKGYEIFSKGSSIKGVVIASVAAIAVIVLAWYLCIGYDYYLTMEELAAENPLYFEAIPLSDCLFNGFEFFDFCDKLDLPEIRTEYLGDLAFGLIFTVIAAIGYVVSAVKNAKFAKTNVPAAPTLNGEQNPEA